MEKVRWERWRHPKLVQQNENNLVSSYFLLQKRGAEMTLTTPRIALCQALREDYDGRPIVKGDGAPTHQVEYKG